MSSNFYVLCHQFGQDKVERQRRKDFFLCTVQPGTRLGRIWLGGVRKKEVRPEVIN